MPAVEWCLMADILYQEPMVAWINPLPVGPGQ